MRIGHGFDAHKFGEGNHIIIGGVNIPYSHGMLAHSDGDVLIHALCDALFGAAALGDIGKHFPDDSEALKDIDSRILLRRTLEQLKQRNYIVNNIDITLVAQTPKMAPHIESMRGNLSEDLELPVDAVNIKATTTEGMGFTGRKEGIACYAVVLIDSTD